MRKINDWLRDIAFWLLFILFLPLLLILVPGLILYVLIFEEDAPPTKEDYYRGRIA